MFVNQRFQGKTQMLKTLHWRGLAPRCAGIAPTGLGRFIGGSDLGLRSCNSLQPRLSHWWLSGPGKKPLVNVDYSMRWGNLIVQSKESGNRTPVLLRNHQNCRIRNVGVKSGQLGPRMQSRSGEVRKSWASGVFSPLNRLTCRSHGRHGPELPRSLLASG